MAASSTAIRSSADGLPDIFARLRHWAGTSPDRVLLSEPAGEDRRHITYREAVPRALALKGLLVSWFGLRKGDCVATLLPAGIDALLLKLACLAGGFVHATLPPFPFRDGVHDDATKPFLLAAKSRLIVAPDKHPAIAGMGALAVSELAADGEADETGGASPDDWAAIFFTSGSTGAPKGVPVTRGMISSNQAAIVAMWPFLGEEPPVLVDWLPWHHVFGGLDNIFKMIWNGGTLHVDAAPSPGAMDATVRLIEKVSPTLHIAVPLGLRLLLDRLENDDNAARAFTRRLRAIFFAGAGIDAALWRRLAAFRDGYGDFQILSGYGATEAASTICLSPAPLERPGELGYPCGPCRRPCRCRRSARTARRRAECRAPLSHRGKHRPASDGWHGLPDGRRGRDAPACGWCRGCLRRPAGRGLRCRAASRWTGPCGPSGALRAAARRHRHCRKPHRLVALVLPGGRGTAGPCCRTRRASWKLERRE